MRALAIGPRFVEQREIAFTTSRLVSGCGADVVALADAAAFQDPSDRRA